MPMSSPRAYIPFPSSSARVRSGARIVPAPRLQLVDRPGRLPRGRDTGAFPPGGDFMLHNGSTVHLRPITSDDKDVLRDAFERLSEQSRYRRFMGGIKLLTPQLLAYLTEV